MTIDILHRRSFAAAWGTTFLINIAWGVIFPLRNIYIHDQGISLVQIGVLGTAGSLSFSIAGVVVGRLSDRFGGRRFMTMGLLFATSIVSLFYLRASQYLHFLILIMIDMGLLGGYIVLIDTMVSSILPKESRGSGFGWYRISGSLGFALAAALLGTITARFGIRSIFIISAGGLFAAAIIASVIREGEDLETGEAESADTINKTILRPSMIGILVATGLVWFIVADLFAMLGSQMAFPFMNIYIHDVLGATAGQIGYISMFGVLAEIPAMLMLGRLSDKHGRAPILALGFLVTTVSWLTLFSAKGLYPAYIAAIFNGMSIVRYSVGVALISDRVALDQRAAILGLANLNFGLGGVIGPILGGAVVDKMGTRNVFLWASAINALASLLFLTYVYRERLFNKWQLGTKVN